MNLNKIINFLNSYLAIEKFKDYAVNGIQIENNGIIEKIYSAVDTNLFSIENCGLNSLLLTHHGLFWGKPVTITGLYYNKFKLFISKNVALYSCHLPLDAHPEIGNNLLLMKELSISKTGEFGLSNSNYIGLKGEFLERISINELVQKFSSIFSVKPVVLSFGKQEELKTVCVVSGSPGRDISDEFLKSGIDILITGEANHELYNFAEDNSLNILCGGHYVTEILGIKALGELVSKEFFLPFEFISHPTGL